MKKLKSFYSFFVLTLVLWAQAALAISDEMKSLVFFETRANAVSTRSEQKTTIYHYEIPLKLLEADVAKGANKGYIESMTFEKNGEKYVRWVLNPEDTRWEKAIRVFLLRNGIQPEKKTYFEGYMTASRSYIIVDPKTGVEFSLKTSTNKTGGHWADKKQTWIDAEQIRMLDDYVAERLSKQPRLQNAIVLTEPMAFGIKKYDMGLVIRSYENLPNSGKTYVPGFSILHDVLGKELALKNGSNDPAAYWNEHYNKPLARALAELFIATGIRYDSPHSQNFLVELNEKLQPTGKIVLRDFGDSYVYTKFFGAAKRMDVANAWEKGNILTTDMSMTVGTLHGNRPPSWIDFKNDFNSPKSYSQWGRDFFAEFEAEFFRQTGIELKADRGIIRGEAQPGYFSRSYDVMLRGDNDFLRRVSQDKQREFGAARLCERVFAN